MKRRVPVLQIVSSAVISIGLVAGVLLCNKLVTQERAEIARTTAAEVRHIAVGLKIGALQSFEHLERLGKWWLSQGKPFDLEDWRTDGQLFLSRSTGLRRAAWVGTDGIQHWWAEQDAEPVIEDTMPDALVQQVISVARSSRALTTSQVFPSAGIPAAIYVCVPISQKGRPRGYVVGLYDAAALISSLTASVVRPDEYISVTSGERRIYSIAPDSIRPGVTVPEANATAPVELPNQAWTVTLRVPLRYFRHFRQSIFTVVCVIGALIYSLAMLIYLSQRRSSELERSNAALEAEVSRRRDAELEVRQLNQELKRKVADFETLIDVIPIGIAVAYDAACRNVSFNPALAEMMGLPGALRVADASAGALNLPCGFVSKGQKLGPDESPMHLAAATGKKLSAEELQILRGDGTTVDVLSFASPVFDEDGRVRGVIHAVVDVSARKQEERVRRELERRLNDAERVKCLGVMAGGIAHTFNNLLTAVIGELSLAMEVLYNPGEAKFHLAASMQSAERAAGLVHEVLAYTGRAFHTLKPIDLADVVRDMRPALASLAGPKLEISFNLPSALPHVRAATDEVQHALQHLVVNALEATEAVGSVTISVDSCQLSGKEPGMTPPDSRIGPGSYVRLKVGDNGPGMPGEIAEKAFDPFFSTKFQGRGLGLSVVLGIMRAHKGAVRLATAPNSGTSVELFFPAEHTPAGVVGAGLRSVAADALASPWTHDV